MGNESALPYQMNEQLLWNEVEGRIWLSTRFSLHRNVSGFPFPQKIQSSIAKEIQKDLIAPLLDHLHDPKTLLPHNLIPSEREFLFEHFLVHDSYEKFDESRALVVDAQMGFLATINLDDHMTLHLCSSDPDLQKSYAKLESIEASAASRLHFAYSPRFGYLTTNPFLCGTAFVVEPILHLPALIHMDKATELLEEVKEHLLFPGFGKEDDYLGDVIILENKYKLGLSEESILQEVQTSATLLVEAEKALREELKVSPPTDLQDKIARAYALIHSARLLSTEETLSALSLLELGSSLGWVEKSASLSFQKMFFHLRRGHLLFSDKELTIEDLPQFRATMIKNHLSSIKLNLVY